MTDNNQERPRRNNKPEPKVYVSNPGDLREKLNKKRAEKDIQQERKGPPPDPAYNFLRDPERDGEFEEYPESPRKDRRHDVRPSSSNTSKYHSNYNKPFNQGYANQQNEYGRGGYRKHHPSSTNRSFGKEEQNSPIYNIKVELKAESGERTYTIDKTNPLPPIAASENMPQKSRSPQMYNRGSRNNKPNYSGGNQRYHREQHDNEDTTYIRTTNFYSRRGHDKFRNPRGRGGHSYRGKPQTSGFKSYNKRDELDNEFDQREGETCIGDKNQTTLPSSSVENANRSPENRTGKRVGRNKNFQEQKIYQLAKSNDNKSYHKNDVLVNDFNQKEKVEGETCIEDKNQLLLTNQSLDKSTVETVGKNKNIQEQEIDQPANDSKSCNKKDEFANESDQKEKVEGERETCIEDKNQLSLTSSNIENVNKSPEESTVKTAEPNKNTQEQEIDQSANDNESCNKKDEIANESDQKEKVEGETCIEDANQLSSTSSNIENASISLEKNIQKQKIDLPENDNKLENKTREKDVDSQETKQNSNVECSLAETVEKKEVKDKTPKEKGEDGSKENENVATSN